MSAPASALQRREPGCARTTPILRRPHPKHDARPIAPRAHPLARRFFELLDEQGIALTDIAERAGLSVATLVKWKYRHAPTVVALEAALNALGYRLAIVKRKATDVCGGAACCGCGASTGAGGARSTEDDAMTESASDTTPVTLREIGELCRAYADAREALEEVAEEIRSEQRAAVRRKMYMLNRRIAEVSAAKDALREAVTSAPALFEKPRTRAIEGVKVGYRKMPGRVEFSEESKVIARIRARLAGREAELIRIKERLDLGALKKLNGPELATIGARIVDVDDEIVIAAAADDLDKLVDALLADGEDASGEAA